MLPANREALTLETADGLKLVGELATPLVGPPVATMVCLHPLPTHGGMMDSHIFRKAAFRLPALAGIAVLRFNTRGTWSVQGTSEGTFDEGRGEALDVSAAIEYAEYADLPSIWLVGWSFGTDLALMHGQDPAVVGRDPAVAAAALLAAQRSGGVGRVRQAVDRPDPRTRRLPATARGAERFAAIPHAEVIAMAGSKHLWVGDAERVLDEIVRRLAPPSRCRCR